MNSENIIGVYRNVENVYFTSISIPTDVICDVMYFTKGALSVIFSSIAIELNVQRDDFSSIAIELNFVTLGHGFKKADSVLFDICAPGTRTF